MNIKPSTVTIRPATDEDRPAIVAMTMQFARELPSPFRLNPTEPNVQGLINIVFEHGVIFLAENGEGPFGMLALVRVPHPLTGAGFVDELAWWVHPGHRNGRAGPKLLLAGERWTRSKGEKTLKMVAPHPSDVGRFYLRRGYKPVETSYVKVW